MANLFNPDFAAATSMPARKINAPTETIMNSWTGHCGDAVSLRNRRMLIHTIWLIGIGSSLLWLHPHFGDVSYWTS